MSESATPSGIHGLFRLIAGLTDGRVAPRSYRGAMKAIRFATFGGPEVLELVDVDAPRPGPGQIRIRVHAAGVNGLDRRTREGDLPQVRPSRLPAGIGGDAAGVVDEVGDGVTDVRTGDAVFGSGAETYAEQAVLTSWAVKPDAVSFAEAAGCPVPFETGLRVLRDVDVRAGQTLLANGASGGVGSVVVQVALARGVSVIGVAGPANQEYLAALGAAATTYGPGLTDRVRAIAPGGVDLAIDVAGSGILPELIALVGEPGAVVSIADFSAPRYGARVSIGFGADKSPALREGARLVTAGTLTLPVERTFPLAAAADAQRANATGHARGRLIVTVP
jgi:NADPH:quinone reductase-like Zn-dependent oxidoreductase